MGQQFFRPTQRYTAIVSKEPKVTNFDEACGEHMLEETLDELFDREGAEFELPGIGSAVLKSNLRLLHAAFVNEVDQTAIADGNPVNIWCKILEGGLPIPNRQTMHDPILKPDLFGDL